MSIKRNRIAGMIRYGWLLAGWFLLSSIVHVPAAGASTHARVEEAYGKLPLYFEANQGQVESPVRYLARGIGYTLLLSPTEAVISSASPDRPATLHMRLVGGRIRYQGVYPGVDLVYYGNQGRLEYDFIVAPEVDPARITLDFQGVDRLEVTDDGTLVMHTGAGVLRQRPPVLYQISPGPGQARLGVAGGYVLRGPRQVGFQVAAYDSDLPLVIDPVLEYSTYLGDSEFGGWGIAVDSAHGRNSIHGLPDHRPGRSTRFRRWQW